VAEIIQLNIEHGYHDFVSLVSNGRAIPMADMDDIAEGRIWTGQDALENGLVDQLGDLNAAIDYAVSLAELNAYQLDKLEVPMSPRERFIAELFDSKISQALASHLPQWTLLQQIKQQAPSLEQFNDPMGQYSFCAVCEGLQ
jgi:protease-4